MVIRNSFLYLLSCIAHYIKCLFLIARCIFTSSFVRYERCSSAHGICHLFLAPIPTPSLFCNLTLFDDSSQSLFFHLVIKNQLHVSQPPRKFCFRSNLPSCQKKYYSKKYDFQQFQANSMNAGIMAKEWIFGSSSCWLKLEDTLFFFSQNF